MSRHDRRMTQQKLADQLAPAATHERILHVLSITQRPLGSGELQNALGLFTHEAREACNWLKSRGYVRSIARFGKRRSGDSHTRWSLADKGRDWARERHWLIPLAH
ncbi:MAG TPA: hypothetical protein VIL32_00820 [Steroidobacteraceae bacterium]